MLVKIQNKYININNIDYISEVKYDNWSIFFHIYLKNREKPIVFDWGNKNNVNDGIPKVQEIIDELVSLIQSKVKELGKDLIL